MTNKKPDDKKLVVKNEDYITALYCILQSMKDQDPIVINAKAFRELSFCKEKIKVEYNADLDAYRFSLKDLKRKRTILTKSKRLVLPPF